ncbi:MAG: AraC family transcriptional regulator [Planctomycetaceae bacterium]|nr:AraC family transcriptional regulator [Planctomycetaceae bacterium]
MRDDRKIEQTVVASIDVGVLQSLFDLNPDIAFFVKNRAGRYIAVNDSLLARHGLKRKSEALGKRPQDICPGDFGRLPTEQDQRVLSTGKPLIDYLELQWYRPGAAVWCLTSKLPLKDQQGQVIGLIGFSRDLRAPVATEEIPVGFARAMSEFEQDLSQPFSPAILARRSGLTSNRLGRLTKRLFSLTPSQLLAKTRVAAASLLLRESSLSIVEIAQQCGYADQSAFTRAFRTLTSVTPSEFRRDRPIPTRSSV